MGLQKLLQMLAMSGLTAATGGAAAPLAGATGLGGAGLGITEGASALTPEVAGLGAAGGLEALPPELLGSGLDDALAGHAGMGDPGIGSTSQPGSVNAGFNAASPITDSTTGKSPLDWDWAGAADRAKSFVKLANQAQDFSSKMKGQVDPNQRLSEASGQQPGGKTASSPSDNMLAAPAVNMPPTRLAETPPMVDPLERLRMMQARGY